MQNKNVLDEALIHYIRQQATSGVVPTDILFELSAIISDRETFVSYVTTAFFDEDLAWIAASRWWRGDMSAYAVNTLLFMVIKKNKHHWE